MACGFQLVLPLLQMLCSVFFILRVVNRADGSQYQHSCMSLDTADNSFKIEHNRVYKS